MRILALLLLVVFSSVAGAQEDSVNRYESASMVISDVVVSGSAQIVKEDANAHMKKAVVNLSLFPKEFNGQKILSQQSIPQAKLGDGSALFEFFSPQDEITFEVRSSVQSYADAVAITRKVPFPIKELPQDVQIYLKPTEIIDSNDSAINTIASQLVSGEDDLYRAVFLIAQWTRQNVDYNLSSLTADVSQKASWVLAERKGVCDEITSLFIAMLRSIGIPAKFVTGYAYTNSALFPQEWGAHGWAEVYFPGYGWVPYDVTYGQFGFLDATHIKMHEAADPDEASTRYEWLGNNVELDLNELQTSIVVERFEEGARPFVQIQLEPFKKEIGFGSAQGIEAKITNLQQRYVSSELRLSVPEEIEIMGEKTIDVVLLPKEETSVFWIVQLSSGLDENFRYTFPLEVRSSDNAQGVSSFASTFRSPQYSLQEISAIIGQFEEEEQKIYSINVELQCSASKSTFYAYEDAHLYCTIHNTGNVILENLNICLREDCEQASLGIAQSSYVEFPIDTEIVGKRDERMTVTNNQVSKAAIIPLEVLDIPAVEIHLNHTMQMDFEQASKLSLEMEKTSYSSPQEVLVTLELPHGMHTWTLLELDSDQRIDTVITGKELHKGENIIRASVSYKDGNRREYATIKESTILLTDVTFGQQLQIIWAGLEHYLYAIDPTTLSFILLLSLVVFVVVTIVVFKSRSGHSSEKVEFQSSEENSKE